jgi:hypothetical protein
VDDDATDPLAGGPAAEAADRDAKRPAVGRAELDELLRAAREIGDPGPLYAMLAETAPLGLAEVACGARAPGGPAHVRAALAHVAVLEKQLTARGVYPRLVELAPELGPDVLRRAAERHPAAVWLVKLSRKVEGKGAGAIHLTAAAQRPSFAQSCVAHAEAGHAAGLLAAAEATGRPEPAAALLALDIRLATRAAAAALAVRPDSAVVAHVAAAWGPEPDLLVARVVPYLRTRSAAEGLLAQARHLPHTTRLLRAVIPGMAG